MEGGERHTHFMVHVACTGAAQLLSIVVRQTVSHANEIYTDILQIANSCGNWCVRTFIRTYVHVQKVWHLKKKCQITFMPRGKKWAHEASAQGMALGENCGAATAYRLRKWYDICRTCWTVYATLDVHVHTLVHKITCSSICNECMILTFS